MNIGISMFVNSQTIFRRTHVELALVVDFIQENKMAGGEVKWDSLSFEFSSMCL